MVKPALIQPQEKAQTEKFFSDDPDMVSYYRWLNYALEKFRNVCKSDKEISLRIIFLHRPEGRWPLVDQEVNNKIDRAIEMKRKIFIALGKRENESVDLFHQRMVDKHRHRVAITMTETGAIDHWQPPIQDYRVKNKPNPRRPMTEQAMAERMNDADNFVGGFL